MLIKNKNISVKLEKGLIKSIKYKDREVLYQGEEGWKKTFPICFPVVGFSDAFVVNDKNYLIQKHGFWNSLHWEEIIENNTLVSLALVNDLEKFPFILSLKLKVFITESEVFIDTEITNASKETAYFHFGYHPAFYIDKNTKLIANTNKKAKMISIDSKFIDSEVEMKEFVDLPFGVDFDTLVFKEVDFDKIKFINNDLTMNLTHNANNLQIWKPKDDNFICIEPWYGVGDREFKLIENAKDKPEINVLNSAKTWTASMSLKFKLKDE